MRMRERIAWLKEPTADIGPFGWMPRWLYGPTLAVLGVAAYWLAYVD
jgi:hypothetical protein